MRYAAMIAVIYLVINGCITPYELSRVEAYRRILVVDGLITDSITTIRLSRSVGLTERLNDLAYVNHATVFVECDDGTVSDASQLVGGGNYTILTGDLNPQRKYRLKIILDEEEYRSEFLSPLTTPDFMLSWVKMDNGARVSFNVSTQDTLNQSSCYLWSYKEDWEFTARILVDSFCINYEWVFHDINAPDNHYYCWKKDSSRVFILANAEGMIGHEIRDREIYAPSAATDRFSLLYHIAVKQNLIRKEAYAYYTNLQNNVERTSNIFAPIPAERQGNLYCVTTPELPVIGYVDVSTTVERKRFITRDEAYIGTAYYPAVILDDCTFQEVNVPPPECLNTPQFQWVYVDWRKMGIQAGSAVKSFYVTPCVDCIAAGGTKDKPSWWPTEHL